MLHMASGFAVIEAKDRRTGRRLVIPAADGAATLIRTGPEAVARAALRNPDAGLRAFLRSLRAHPRTFEWSVLESGLATVDAARERAVHWGLARDAFRPLGFTPIPTAEVAERVLASPAYAAMVADRLVRDQRRSRRARRWAAGLRVRSA